MEKKGEILNQLAIISDLLEKINLETTSTTLVIELTNVEFDKVFEIIKKKNNKKIDKPNNTFNITIGNVDIVFNTNNA
jgi:phosphoribosylaminoimidazole (AIR) synthetase